MLTNNEIAKVQKDLHTYQENLLSQPIKIEEVFNRADRLTCGWIPVVASKKLKKKNARSFTIFNQRVVVFRKENGNVYALDAFCPHMGADLGNGKVVQNQ